ncbi:hypothetical protein BGZ92_004337, partial [Podila epicladia]
MQPNEPTSIRRVNYTAINALDDNFSAGSGSETRSKSKAKRKSNNRVNTTTVPHIDRNASSSSLLAVDSPSISPSMSSAPSPTPSLSSSPLGQPQDLTSASGSDPTDTRTITIERTAVEQPETSATYETEDNENDFISTQDRRRRRKAKALRSNSANQSSESITKTSLPDQREQHSGSTPLEHPKPSQELVADKASTTLLRDQNQGQGQFSSRSTVQANQKESSLSPQSPTFNHPLHALNSTSPIVRLKPTHKRSQSAQLPASSPWSIPYSQPGNTRPFQGSSLSQVSLPVETSTAVASHAPVSSMPTTATTTTTSISTLALPPIDTSKTETQATEPGGYGLFGQSSIWYSPFQSGLDITIEGDQEVRVPKLPKPRIQVQSIATQKKPSLGVLASSSFFESSPRTPRIMPFSQHHVSISDAWSVRARSSSIAAPMTPLLESDCADPMDYFGGSRSANSSRRGSVENNLTESLLSGRARMFASEPNMNSSPPPPDLPDLAPSGGSMSNSTLNENSFLSHSHYGSLAPSSTTSAFPNMMTTNLAQPSTLDSGLDNSMGSMPGIFPTEETAAPAFVNPWDPPFQYHSHSGSETFLPFGSTMSYDTSSTLNADLEVDQGRQASLLKLMNGDRGDVSLGTHGHGASGDQGLRGLSTFGNGFLFPSRDPLPASTLPESSSTGGYQPFASIEMSLAAAANQRPVLEDDPKYDFVELAIQSSDFANKKR